MGYKRTTHTVYAVAIPGGIVKIGYSAGQRWRNFVARGARVLWLVEFPDTLAGCREALEYESAVHRWMSERFPPGYASKAEANAALGIGGAGFKECYAVPDPDSKMAQPLAPHMATL